MPLPNCACALGATESATADYAANQNGNGNGVATNGSAKTPHREALAEAPTNGTSVVSRTPAGAWRGGEAAHWLSAYEAIQCRTAEAHAVYQQTMAQCHMAFLRTAEQSALALASIAVGASQRVSSISMRIR